MDDLTLRSLQGKSLAEKLEIAGRWAGADGPTMDGIWRTESGRGQAMLSPAGARGHFGLMPPTTATWSERLGFAIDPDNFDHALIAGAHTLRENLQRFGNLPDALRAYNGGWERSRWNNPETAAYVGKVLGGNADAPMVGNVAPARQRGPAAPPTPENILEAGNIDLENRPRVRNSDGSISTVRSMSFGTDRGEVLIPTVSDDGRILSEEDAIAEFERTGKHLGIFGTSEEATSYAEQLHTFQENFYSGDAPSRTPTAVLRGQVSERGPSTGVRPEDVLSGTAEAPAPAAAPSGETARFIGQLGGFRPFSDPNATSLTGMLEVNAAQTGAVVEQTREEQISGMDRFSAAVRLNTITGNLIDAIDQQIPARDADFDYEANMAELEEGRTERQRIELRERATSFAGAQQIIERQDREGELREVAGEGLVTNLTAGLIDPAGFLLGGGIGKLLQGGGLGARTLFQSGQRGAASLSLIGEGVAGNVAGTAIIDRVAGSYQAPEDYAVNGLFGALLGTAAIPFVSRSSTPDRGLQTIADDMVTAVNADEADILAEAITRAGPASSNESIQATADSIRSERVAAIVNDSFGPVPEENRLFSPEDAETVDQAARGTRLTELGGDALSDDMQRNLVGQLVERSEAIVARNPISTDNQGAEVLRRIGMASTGQTLLRSQDPVAQAVGLTLTEGTTGHGGRRHSAALTASLNERRFMRPILAYEDNFHIYRQSRGQGWMQFAFGNGALRQQFDIEVAAELRARARPDLYASTAPDSVRQAADYMAAGYKLMGEEQVRAGTLGSQNIKPGDPSYFPQHVSSAKIQRLDVNQQAAFRGIISEQARTMFGWDQKFSDYFGRRYLESAIDRAAGNYDVPVNLTHQSAGGFVEDLLENMRAGAAKEDIARIDKASQKFARGGAGFTKGRLNFDVMSTYKLDDGSEVRLLDIMDTDMVGMYRAYARRSAGEIALQQYGIAGSHGLKTIRKYLAIAHDAGRITNDELGAFDQIAAEFLNTPFGKHQGNMMDNLRIITSTIKLGGMGITQFGEYGNGIAALGWGRVLTSVKDIPRLMGEIGTIRKGGEVHGLLSSIEKQQGFEAGMDSFILTRALDVKDNDVQMYGREGLGLGTRVIRGASHAQAILSGHRMVTAVQVRGMSEQIIRKAFRFIKAGQEDTALADMGFSPELRAAVKGSIDKMAKFNGDEIVSLDIFAGDLTPAQRQELVGVINRGSAQIIQQTYIGETGKWAHDGFLKLLTQFRTFSLTAVEKQWGRNLRNYGALKSMMFLMGAMSFAAPIHMARVHARMLGMSEADREAYAEKYLSPAAIAQATMTYASAAGFGGDIWDIGGSAMTNIMGDAAPEWLQGTINPRGGARSQGKLLGGVVAPSASVAEDAFALANGDWKKIKSLLPGANLPYVVPIINAMESAEAED